MPYIKETCVAGDTIEVCKYYTYRVNVKGEKRAKKEKQTSEAQKKVNQRKAEKELRRLMAANYKNGDVVVRLDFFRRPGGSEEMQPLIEKAIRKLRSAYNRAGKQLKYIYVKEVGPRGSRHIHMILNREEMDILSLLTKCWPHGGIQVFLIHTHQGGERINGQSQHLHIHNGQRTRNKVRELHLPAGIHHRQRSSHSDKTGRTGAGNRKSGKPTGTHRGAAKAEKAV